MSKKNKKNLAVPKNTDIQKPNATEAVKLVKKKEKKVVESPKMVKSTKATEAVKLTKNDKQPIKKDEMSELFKTSYHFYRNWIRNILQKGKVKVRFVKDKTGWTGIISVNNSEIETAKKVLADYKTKNPDEVSMWW